MRGKLEVEAGSVVGGGGDKVPLGARAILLVTDHRECHRFLHKSNMSIPDHIQHSCQITDLTSAFAQISF